MNLSGYCQTTNTDTSFNKVHLEGYIGVNLNFSPSNSMPLNFWAFYDYRDERYWQFDKYYPLLDNLNGASAIWTLESQPEIGIRFLNLKNDLVGFGFNLVLTGNKSKAILTSNEKDAKAELTFNGQETRIMFQPSMGFKINKFYSQFNLVLGLGFNKNYDSFLTVTDENGIQTTMSYDNDLFYNLDYSIGIGFGIKYEILKKMNLGLTYNVYRVNTSAYQSSGSLDFSKWVNGYWNNSFALTLGYEIK